MKTIAIFELLVLIFLASCTENQKMDKDFTFTIQTMGYVIDAKNNKYTVHTLKGDTTTRLSLSSKELSQIQHLFLSQNLHKLPPHFNPELDNKIMGESGTKVTFEYNKCTYSFLVFAHERHNFFDGIKVKKIETFVEDVYKIIDKKENIKRMPKSDAFSL